MENISLINKKMVSSNKKLKLAQKKAGKHFQTKLFERAKNCPKARIKKIARLDDIAFQEFRTEDKAPLISSPGGVTRGQLIELCKKTALTGKSGNGFLTYKKLESFNSEDGLLIVNGAECDPGLVHDGWIYRNRIDTVIEGIELVKQALKIQHVILATKEPLDTTLNVTQIKVADRFPVGYENFLIKAVTGKEIPKSKLPSECGILVLNIQTVLAIREAFDDEFSCRKKYITVADITEGEAKVTRVTVGDSVEEIASELFSIEQRKGKTLYTGSGALFSHKAENGETVTEETGYIALGNAPDYEGASKCRGCGACSRNCPAKVEVCKVVGLAEKNELTAQAAKALNVNECIGCGACTYGCMAGKDTRKIIMGSKELV
ncbi:MAG: 4Fe-4S dicluster domain-containing protein [Treponema sp.]